MRRKTPIGRGARVKLWGAYFSYVTNNLHPQQRSPTGVLQALVENTSGRKAPYAVAFSTQLKLKKMRRGIISPDSSCQLKTMMTWRPSLFLWWRIGGSNPWPLGCQQGSNPCTATLLTPRTRIFRHSVFCVYYHRAPESITNYGFVNGLWTRFQFILWILL